MEAGFVDRVNFSASQSFISSQSVLSECRTFSWHWSLAKNKETRTNEEWKQIGCSIKKYKSRGKVGGVRLCCERRRRVRLGKNMEREPNAVERFSSVSRGYNGSFPHGANWIQTRSDRKMTPSQPPLHSCLRFHPLLCGHAPSLSPASSLVIFTVFLPAPNVLNMSECLGERGEPESQSRAPGTRRDAGCLHFM